jgi:uncharacterized protein YgfB (UPF0149 family)
VTASPSNPSLDYDRLRDSLAAAGAVVALAELHGGVCGALCMGSTEAASGWLAGVFDDEHLGAVPAELASELEDLVGTSVKMLDGEELQFEPLLPGDEAPLAEQVEALAAWCQGFLNGIGSAGPAAARAAAEHETIGEILRDFAEIARAGLSDEEAAGDGQPDFALAEIQGHVRVGVQLVFEELAPLRAASAPDLH